YGGPAGGSPGALRSGYRRGRARTSLRLDRLTQRRRSTCHAPAAPSATPHAKRVCGETRQLAKLAVAGHTMPAGGTPAKAWSPHRGRDRGRTPRRPEPRLTHAWVGEDRDAVRHEAHTDGSGCDGEAGASVEPPPVADDPVVGRGDRRRPGARGHAPAW